MFFKVSQEETSPKDKETSPMLGVTDKSKSKNEVMSENGRIWIEETNFKWSHQCEYTEARPYDRVEVGEKEECASNCLKDDRCAYFYWAADTCYKIKDQKGNSLMTEVISADSKGTSICGFIIEKVILFI